MRKFLVREKWNGRILYSIVNDEPPKIARDDRPYKRVLRELEGEELTMSLDALALIEEEAERVQR